MSKLYKVVNCVLFANNSNIYIYIYIYIYVCVCDFEND